MPRSVPSSARTSPRAQRPLRSRAFDKPPFVSLCSLQSDSDNSLIIRIPSHQMAVIPSNHLRARTHRFINVVSIIVVLSRAPIASFERQPSQLELRQSDRPAAASSSLAFTRTCTPRARNQRDQGDEADGMKRLERGGRNKEISARVRALLRCRRGSADV